MELPDDLYEEIKLLNRYKLDNISEGLKIHHNAEDKTVAAAQRLNEKELTTLEDGGYLTQLGIQAAEHAQKLISILQSAPHVKTSS